MADSPYIRIRFQREEHWCGVTLSIPSGLERALTLGRLPKDAEARLGDAETWVPLMLHPAAEQLLAATAPASDEPVRRAALRSGSRVRVSQPAKVIVAGGESEEAQATLWRRQLHAVQRWAAAL